MLRLLGCGIVAALSFNSTRSIAQLPPSAQLQADLAGQFATTAPKQIVHPAIGLTDQRLTAAMHQQAAYLVRGLKPWKGDPTALSITASRSNEHGIRPNTGIVYGLASLYRTVDSGYRDELSREKCRDTAIAMLRFILPTHGAGGVKCDDGKQWYNQWQSALWANLAGRGCWLLWDDLSPEMKWMAARMICDEADRFINQPPPSQVENDTKAEENAWNSTVIALAFCMFPHHPHSEQWREAAIRWTITSFARKEDLTSTTIYDGKPLKEWLTGANLHDDFTLENHHRVHPDYMNTVNLLLYQRELYDWAGKQPPQAIQCNTAQVYSTLKKLSLPDGGFIYPNGQDWQLRRNPQWHEVHAMQAVLFRDPEASLLFSNCLETMEKMLARGKDVAVFLPEEYSFPSTQTDTLMMLALTHHLVQSHGEPVAPISDEQFRQRYSGLHMFSAGKFALLRTPGSIASFSWGPQVMGNVLPLQKDLLLAPNERNMIGRMRFDGVKGDTPTVDSATVLDSTSTLGVIGRLSRAGKTAKQHFAFVALPDGRCVYADQVELTTKPKVLQMDLGLLSVLNDPHWIYSNGERKLHHGRGVESFMAEGPDNVAPIALQSNWYNLDDRLGIAVLSGSGTQSYLPNHKMSNGRLEQPFTLNSIMPADSGETTIAPTVLVFYPGKDARTTSQLAEKCKAEAVSLTEPFRVTLDDGVQISISFSDQKLGIK